MSLAIGADIWILENNSAAYWWKKIDFQSGFFLSKLGSQRQTGFVNSESLQTQKIVKQTEFPQSCFKTSTSPIFIGTENHFFNKWICLVENLDELKKSEVIDQFTNLNCLNLRLFIENEKKTNSIELLSSLKARFSSVEIISSP